MSHDASPVQSAPPPHAIDSHQNDPDTFDLFADVSHHGASLFELFSVPAPLDSLPPPRLARASDAAVHPRAQDGFHQPNPPLSTELSLHRQHRQQQVDSYCTADPADLSAVPVQSVQSVQNGVSQVLSPVSSGQRSAPSAQATDPRKLPPKLVRPKKTRRPAKKSPSPLATPEAPKKSTPKLAPTKAIAKPRSSPSPISGAPGNTARRKRPLPRENLDVDFDSDASEAVTGSSKQPSPSTRQPPPPDTASGSGGEGQSKDTHNSHTRRCRAKVNSKFQELLSILPTPPPKTGIKHKAQILDYTIRVFREIHARKTLLEAELALSSRAQLNAWVESVVFRSLSLQDALAPYLSLICTKGGWKYSEAWVPTQDSVRNGVTGGSHGMSGDSRVLTPAMLAIGPHSKLRLGLAVIPSLGNTDDPDLQAKLERFRDRSRPYGFKARVDLPGRIMCTMRPEWLPSLEDQEAFQRAKLAREASLVVCFGVPIFVRGHVAAVAVFFDTEQRAYDAKCVDLADNVAALLGNAFGASAAKRGDLR